MLDIHKLKSLASDIDVLYVEDEPELRDSLTKYLSNFFDRVDIAKDGLDGLKHYQEHQYGLVVTDIEMPKMNGIEMTSKIRAINPEQEIIIISAYGDQKYFIDAIRLGVSSYLVKPVKYEEINTTLYNTLNKIVQFRENILYKNNLEEMVKERTNKLLKLENDKLENFEKTLKAFINMIESRDTYTAGHSERVANYSKLIAVQLGCSKEECELVYQAGILHDIGKIATPDTILLKPGKLTYTEYTLIQEHVNVGHELLSHIPMYNDISKIILSHHEKYNGTGYPNGLSGDEIPFLSRIMMVADAFDAMTTNRIYKGRKSIAQALDELEELSGMDYHPKIVDSAIIALGKIKIIDNVSQRPNTKIEKERFSYFYKDQLSGAYNIEYLEYILNANNITKKYQHLNVVYIHNFNQYNNRKGWSEGDKLLINFYNYLSEKYPQAIIFRIHSDDYVLLTESDLKIDMNQFDDMDILLDSKLSFSKRTIDLNETVIENLDTIRA